MSEEQTTVPGYHDTYTGFKLEQFLQTRSQNNRTSGVDVFVEREIERHLASGRFQLAYDMYCEEVEAPEDFQEFIARRVDQSAPVVVEA